jgi:hypothetical protein
MDDESIHRKASDQVQNDDGLIAVISSSVAKALGLDVNNRTLGRKIVRLALAAKEFETFKDGASDFGNINSDTLKDIFHSVQSKYASVTVQIKNSSFEDESENDIAGFSSKGDKLVSSNGPGLVGPGLVGGLVKRDSQHVFQAPVDKPKGVSLLGLDKLAQKKREADGKGKLSMGSMAFLNDSNNSIDEPNERSNERSNEKSNERSNDRSNDRSNKSDSMPAMREKEKEGQVKRNYRTREEPETPSHPGIS